MDAHRFLISQTDGESGATTFTRSAVGQPLSRTDARGVVTTYAYDAIGRLTEAHYQPGASDASQDVTRTYDSANDLVHLATAQGGSYDYTFDELNRLANQSWSGPAICTTDAGYQTSYQYDSAGCLRALVYPSGATVSMTCDSDNRTISVAFDGTPIVTSVSYHPSGQPAIVKYGNGLTSTTTFDNRARVTSLYVPKVLGLSYSYDGVDNVSTRCRDTGNLKCASSSGTIWNMMYDNEDRLISVYETSNWTGASYEFDVVGNRTAKYDNFSSYSSWSSYTYDEITNRLATIGSSESYPSMTFTWDLSGHLATSSDGASYSYDGLDRRVAKVTAEQSVVYHYDAAGRLIAESLADGTKLRDYIYLGQKLVAVSGCIASSAPPCTELQWYHSDPLGSTLARTDASGAIVASLEYRP